MPMAGALTVDTRRDPAVEPAAEAAATPALAVRVEDLSVRLELQKERVMSLRESAIRFLERRPVETEEFWPVRNVSFDVHRGEVFGIVGRNGAGKSTLLKVVAGVVAPTRGDVEVIGRIAPLLELGAGFDPEMTGRENVFLYGSLLGFPRRRLLERFDHIVQFAELEEFIDVPLKNYSSGMSARLGFAVATDVDADLLIVDEALTVGDSRFQLKCLERIEVFRSKGMSILFVSHSLEQVRRLCTRALWIEGGETRGYGPVGDVLDAYEAAELDKPAAAHVQALPSDRPAEHAARRLGNAIERVQPGVYDFIDISTHDPNSVVYCERRFGGEGLGISKSQRIVDGYLALGFDAFRVDPLHAVIPESSVGLVSIMDALHFFQAPDGPERIVAQAARWARDFVFIRIPSFEDVDYLKSFGLKFFWYDWTIIPAHLRLDRLTESLRDMGLVDYHVSVGKPVVSSDVPTILPASAPPDQGEYSRELHGAKPSIEFPRPVFAQIDLYIALRKFETEEWRRIVSYPF